MNNNQNIDEILKQLKTSVSSEQPSDDRGESTILSDEYSDEIVQRKLKNQYLSSNDNTSYISENEYLIDKDFLSEAKSLAGEPDVEDDISEYIADNNSADEDVDEIIDEANDDGKNLVVIETSESDDSGEVIEELVEAIDSFTEDVEDVREMFEDEFEDDAEDTIDENSDDVEIEDNEEDESVIDVEHPSDTDIDGPEIPISLIASESVSETFDEEFETEDYEQDIVYTAIELKSDDNPTEVSVDVVAVEHVEEVETVAENLDPVEQEVSEETQPKSTYISTMRNSGIDLSANDSITKNDSDIESADASGEPVEDVVDNADDDLDLSTINLMMQLGDHEEVAERIGNKNIENIIEESEAAAANDQLTVEDNDEYVSKDQDESIRASYKKQFISLLFSMCGCILLAIMSLIFDVLPIFEVALSGIFDYSQYPSFYVLIGLQFVIFISAICIKQLKNGLQGISAAAPNRYSLVVIIIFASVIYSIVTAIAVAIGGDVIPPLFNGITAAVIALSMAIDFIKIVSNTHTFNVYSSDASKFTLVDDRHQGKIAEKMYAGGLETNKNVYSVANVDFPRGLFSSLAEKDGHGKLTTFIMVFSTLVSVVVTVLAAIISLDIYAALVAFMLCMFASMPVCFMFAENIPIAIASLKLSRRGVAIAGKAAVENHAKCDVMVFGDLHMFKKCKTEDIGIAMYDKGVSYLALGCISALYSKIGGPLSGMDMNLPDVFKFQNVDIKRITRTGIEAVIDRKHVLVLGERSFLLRYGIVFPEDDTQCDRYNLCVSLNGGVTAKLSVKYEPEPVFEMLIERLYNEGVTCVIETYDPLINSDMIANNRTLGASPVSVVHKNAEDYRLGAPEGSRARRDDVIACSSRLKLAEAQVWIKKLTRAEKITRILSTCCCGVGVIATMLIVIISNAASFTQYHSLAYLICQLIAITAIMFSILPSNKYFTVDRLYDEFEAESIKEQKKLERVARIHDQAVVENNLKESKTDE